MPDSDTDAVGRHHPRLVLGCPKCVQGYIQDTGFDRCPDCNPSPHPETDAFRERVRSGAHPDYWAELARMERERDEARHLAADFRRRWWNGESLDPGQNHTLAPLPWESSENGAAVPPIGGKESED